jgi:hypoxanthine phosphoribosyltransferase
MTITPEQAAEVLAKAQQLYTQQELEQALDRLAQQISERLAGTNPLLLCVLNGALIPMGHLLTRLDFPLRQDYIHASRYRGDTRGAELEWKGRPGTSLAGQTVMLVDDILDEGVTLATLVSYCRGAGAKEVYSVVLVEKRHDRSNGFQADFVGLQVPDRYVFGFGMDYKEYWRNLPGIYAV